MSSAGIDFRPGRLCSLGDIVQEFPASLYMRFVSALAELQKIKASDDHEID
jgi:hypothetical protein